MQQECRVPTFCSWRSAGNSTEDEAMASFWNSVTSGDWSALWDARLTRRNLWIGASVASALAGGAYVWLKLPTVRPRALPPPRNRSANTRPRRFRAARAAPRRPPSRLTQ